MKSKAYILGFLCGLAAVLLAGLILRFIFKKKYGVCSNEYDERQKSIQGTGYKYAYLTLLAVVLIGGVIEMMTDVSWCSLFTLAIIGLWVSICVFITYCVIRDAYFSLRSRRKPLIIIFLSVGIINLCIGLGNDFWGDGLSATGPINLLTGACSLYLGLMMVLRTIYERRTEVEE